MPQNNRQKAPLPGLKSDMLDPFRPPEGEDPQQQFEIAGNEVFNPTEAEQIYIKSVLLMAEKQFSGFKVMPEDQNVGERFPGIDPVGNYGPIDMKFTQREAILRGILESSPPKVQAYVNGFLDKCKDPQTPFGSMKENMKKTARNHRLASRASKLCADVAGRKLMYQKALNLEVDQSIVQYDKLMQGLEYAADVRAGPVPREITDFYRDTLETELDLGMGTAARTRDQVPPQIHMDFQNLENRVLQSTFANPGNWGKSPEEVARIAEADGKTYDSALASYVTATADRVIDPMFREMEKNAPANAQGLDIEFSRGDLISIDGKTVRETMQEIFQKSGRPGSFADFYKQNVKQAANELVAAGLMAGKRVEAFVPNKYGQIPKEPSQITKTGYEPSPLKPEKFNAWQRFFAKRGFYKAKVARQAEYERVMAARERMKASALASEQASAEARGQERVAAMKNAIAEGNRINTAMPAVADMFFGQYMTEHAAELQAKMKGNSPLRITKTDAAGHAIVQPSFGALEAMNCGAGAYGGFTRSEPVDTCIGILIAQGHDIHDIMNPNKLQAERDGVAREFMEHAKVNDQEWLGRVFYAGHKATLEAAVRMTQGWDIASDAFRGELPYVWCMLHSAFGTSQKLATSGCKEGYLLAACEDITANRGAAITDRELASGSAKGEALNNKINDIAPFCDQLFFGMEAELKLATDPASLDPNGLCNFVTGRMCQENMRPGASIVEQAPSSNEIGAYIAGAGEAFTTEGSSLTKIGSDLLAPENQRDTIQAAASGRLLGSLHSRMGYTAAPLDNFGQPFLKEDFKDALVRQADGSLVKQRTPVRTPDRVPHAAFAIGKEPPDPLQEPQVQELQVQAKQKRAPHKRAPHKQPLQAGGLRL